MEGNLEALVKLAKDGGVDYVYVALIVTAPFMLAIAAVGVKLSSPGPVLFRQHRYGLSGKVVEVWKFRSMSVQEDGDEIPQARRGDPRVTRLGAFLWHTSLDELPQFFNVLQGQGEGLSAED